MESGDPQGASIANAARQDLPSIGQVIPVLPKHAGHIPEMLGLYLTQAEGHPTGQAVFPFF